MCAAKTLEEQQRIWNDHLRGPIIANKLMATVFANPCVGAVSRRDLQSQRLLLERPRRADEPEPLLPGRECVAIAYCRD